MAAIGQGDHGSDHFVLVALERQVRRHKRSKSAESMEEHVGEERVAGDNAGDFAVVYGMDGCSVFDRIELALGFHSIFDTGVVFHSNGLDPGHLSKLLAKGWSVA